MVELQVITLHVDSQFYNLYFFKKGLLYIEVFKKSINFNTYFIFSLISHYFVYIICLHVSTTVSWVMPLEHVLWTKCILYALVFVCMCLYVCMCAYNCVCSCVCALGEGLIIQLASTLGSSCFIHPSAGKLKEAIVYSSKYFCIVYVLCFYLRTLVPDF